MEKHPFAQRVLLLGAGRVGTAVTHLLQAAGADVVGVTSRSERSAESAAARLSTRAVSADDLPTADIYLIGATDPGISGFASTLAGRVPDGSKIVHLSGAHGVAILAPALTEGVGGAALHPVQSCPDVETAIVRLPGSRWGVTTTPNAQSFGGSFVRAVRGVPVHVGEDQRPLWHAASVMTSNGLSALLSLGENLVGEAAEVDPVDVLGPLASGSLENAVGGGGGAATLTGPFVRGEVDTIRRHLAAIDGVAPSLRDSYVAVANVILNEARRGGRLDSSVEEEIRAVLG